MFRVLENGTAPTRATKYSAAVDLYASEDIFIGAGQTWAVGLGVAIDLGLWIDSNEHLFQTPSFGDGLSFFDECVFQDWKNSHYLEVHPRSSMMARHGLISNIGIIDLDYKEEIKLIVHNPLTYSSDYRQLGGNLEDGYTIKKGDRIAQILLKEHQSYLFGIESDIERQGGLGSSGK